VLRSTKAMNAGMGILQPSLVEGDAPSRGKVVIGTNAYSEDAAIAVEQARGLLGKS
jgi:hypothetical protein